MRCNETVCSANQEDDVVIKITETPCHGSESTVSAQQTLRPGVKGQGQKAY